MYFMQFTILQVIEKEDVGSENDKVPDQREKKRTTSISFHSSSYNNESNNIKDGEGGGGESKKIKFQQSVFTKGERER